MAKIKICGLTRTEDIIPVNMFMPDYIGFVFAESKRRIDQTKARELKSMLHHDIQAVGVFVNESIASIAKIVKAGIIDLVQLHGDENEAYIHELKKHTACQIIKAVRVRSAADIADSQRLTCDYLLFDTYYKNSYGGGGKMFDHKLLKENQRLFFLSGGINEQNIVQVKKTNPFCLDISSGVETDGVKDANKIETLIKLGRS